MRASYPRICLDLALDLQDHTAVAIDVDAKPTSSLSWQKQLEEARAFVEKGVSIVWNLDFGCDFLDDEFVLKTRLCALDYFLETLFAPLAASTHGVMTYLPDNGNVYELSSYLRLLYAPIFSRSIHVYLLSDRQDVLFSFDQFPGFTLAVKSPWQRQFPYAFPVLAWDERESPHGFFGNPPFQKLPEKKIQLGVLLPSTPSQIIQSALHDLKGYLFRCIPERLLDQEWDGLDDLIVYAEALSGQGRRKVLGFQAAGGRVISLGNPCGLLEVVSFKAYLDDEA